MTDTTFADEPKGQSMSDDGFLGTLYNVLFMPLATFRDIGWQQAAPDNRLLTCSLATVALISAMTPVVRMAALGGKPLDLIGMVPLYLLMGVLVWGLIAVIVGLQSYAFTGQARIKTFMTLSGFATLPWVFMGPVMVLKTSLGLPGIFLAAILGLLVWLWTVSLFALALMETYRMSLEKALIVLVMPLVLMIVFIGWVGGFTATILQLMPA